MKGRRGGGMGRRTDKEWEGVKEEKGMGRGEGGGREWEGAKEG